MFSHCVTRGYTEMNSINVSYDYFSAISGKLHQVKHVSEFGIRNHLMPPLNAETTVKV